MEPNKPPFDRCEYLLPPGCKDLIDKIHLGQQQSRRKFKWPKPKERPGVYFPLRLRVRALAAALDAKLPTVIALLKEMKVFTSVNQKIEFYTAAKVARRYGYDAKKKTL